MKLILELVEKYVSISGNTIIDTISHLSKYKDKILLIEEGDYKDILEKRTDLINKDTFIYFDPPYVNKAKGLYNHFFYDDDHLDLFEELNAILGESDKT